MMWLSASCIYKSIQQVFDRLKVDQGWGEVGDPLAAMRSRR
jgi:hypothetical protein